MKRLKFLKTMKSIKDLIVTLENSKEEYREVQLKWFEWIQTMKDQEQ